LIGRKDIRIAFGRLQIGGAIEKPQTGQNTTTAGRRHYFLGAPGDVMSGVLLLPNSDYSDTDQCYQKLNVHNEVLIDFGVHQIIWIDIGRLE